MMELIRLYLDWIGCALTIIGCVLVASNTSVTIWGFVVCFISNILWMLYSSTVGLHSLLIMQFSFASINILGIYRRKDQFLIGGKNANKKT